MRVLTNPIVLSFSLAAALSLAAFSPALGADSCPRATIKISEICYAPLSGQPQWVELANYGLETVDVRGMELVAGTNAYSLSIDLPLMPTNGIILVYFDGAADTNDLSFEGDNKAVLHALATNPLGNPAGACSLYQVSAIHTRDTLVDFVAWGAEPGADAALAVEKALWPRTNVFIATDAATAPDGPSFKPMLPGGTLGRLGERWTVFLPADGTPGAANAAALTAPELEFPNDGLVTADSPDKFWWKKVDSASTYEIQISSDSGFVTLVLAGTNTDSFYKPTATLPADVKYWWRVRAWMGDTNVSVWTAAWSFTVGSPPAAPTISLPASKKDPSPGLEAPPPPPPSNSIPVVPLGARKDTQMLAVTPGAASKIMCDRNNGANQGWDAAHNQANIQNNDLESWWCWAVGITMVNNYYGGTLRRDEVVYKVRGDLLHDADAGSSWDQYTPGLFWALGQTNGNNFTVVAPGSARPADATVTNWIDSGRPIYYRRPGHIMVVRGYRYIGTNLFCEFVNTDNDGSTAWWQWNTVNFGGCAVPMSALNGQGRQMDPGVTADADGDGIVDFDEDKRFACDKTKADSDNDKIPDKIEIASWAFPTDGVGGNVAGKTFHIKDVDGDGLDPQVDPDSDNGGVMDGDEDKNANGLKDPGETDVYDKRDDLKLDLVFCIDNTGSMGSYINAVKANAISIINTISTNFFDYRIAAVGYKDFPEEDSNFLFNDFSAFTTNVATITGAINSMGASGGGDTPEAVYSALIHCINGASLGGWRADPVKRAIIVMGDAPPHDPEPHTGYTLATLIADSLAGGVTVAAGAPKVKDTAGLSGPIPIFPVRTGSDSSARTAFLNIATGTAGTLVDAPTAAQVPAQILTVLQNIKLSAAAVVQVFPGGGATELRGATNVIVDASRSVDPEGCGILKYEWDWNGDGTYDETTLTAATTHTYPAGFTGPLALRVTTVGGSSATTTFALPAPAGGSAQVFSQVTSTNIDRQTGLFYETVVLTNTGTAAISGLRLTVSNLAANVTLMGATGTNGAGLPFIELSQSLDAGTNLTVVLAYYVADRAAPAPLVGVEVVAVTAPPAVTGSAFAIRRASMRPDGKMIVEFDTTPGRYYLVEYSSDMTVWKQALPPLKAFGSWYVWADYGPPVTDSPPVDGTRFYRVLLLP